MQEIGETEQNTDTRQKKRAEIFLELPNMTTILWTDEPNINVRGIHEDFAKMTTLSATKPINPCAKKPSNAEEVQDKSQATKEEKKKYQSVSVKCDPTLKKEREKKSRNIQWKQYAEKSTKTQNKKDKANNEALNSTEVLHWVQYTPELFI